MYEYKGEQVTPGDIQVYADKYEMGYDQALACLLYTSPSPRDRTRSRMPSSA